MKHNFLSKIRKSQNKKLEQKAKPQQKNGWGMSAKEALRVNYLSLN